MTPKVSVRMVAYNHERFIGEAIDSVLRQKVDFPYEIVIGEDCSTDNTRGILEEYRRRHPGIIRLLLNEKNRGSRCTTYRAREACRGKYIAFLDGDDYWTSPDKLQRQADLLDRNPDLTISCHQARIIQADGREGPVYPGGAGPLNPVLSIKDALVQNVMPSCSMFFRNGIVGALPREFRRVPMGDLPIQLCCLTKGNAGYIAEIMGAHRFHSEGMWTRGGGNDPWLKIRQARWYILFYKAADLYLKGEYRELIAGLIAARGQEIRSLLPELIKSRVRTTFPGMLGLYRAVKKLL